MRGSVPWGRRLLSGEAGFTLLELTVVSAILGVLAGIVALAVSGRSTESRATARISDVAEVQKAVDSFAGQHPQGRYPTLNGCLPGRVLDLVSLRCLTTLEIPDSSRTDNNNLAFGVREAAVAVDLNGDGDTGDTVTVAPIIWSKAFRDERGRIRRFSSDFIQRDPKHAHDFVAGLDPEAGWKDGQGQDPDRLGNISPDVSGNSIIITAPEGLGSGDNRIDTAVHQYPVWVLDANGTVHNLLAEGKY